MSFIFPQPFNSVLLADIYPSRCQARIPWPAAIEPVLFAVVDAAAPCGCRARTRSYIYKQPDEVVTTDIYRGDVLRVECEPCRNYHNPPLDPHCLVGDHNPLHVAFYAIRTGVVAHVEGGEAGEYAEHRLRIHLRGGRQIIKRIEIQVSD